MPDGFLQYAIEDHPLRILVLDTLEEGRHGGNFCETRAAWLSERLAEAPERPTLIVLHHPPIESGLSWMTENPEAEWVKRLEAIVVRSRQYRRSDRGPPPPAGGDRVGGNDPGRLPLDRAAGRPRSRRHRPGGARRPPDDRRRPPLVRSPPLERSRLVSHFDSPYRSP
jgi:hypothetical protein